MSLFAFSRRVLYFIAFKSWSHCRGNRWCSNSTNFKTSCFQYIQRVCHELTLAYSVCLVYKNCGYNSATVYIKSDALLQQLKKSDLSGRVSSTYFFHCMKDCRIQIFTNLQFINAFHKHFCWKTDAIDFFIICIFYACLLCPFGYTL